MTDPGAYGLRASLRPTVARLLELRDDPTLPPSVRNRLARINGALVALIDDDELGLIDSTPEERVRLASRLRERRNAA